MPSPAKTSGLSRSERKAQAAARRSEWRQRWLDLAQKHQAAKLPFKEILYRIADDAESMAKRSPHLRSEIVHALGEFSDALGGALLRAQAAAAPESQT